MVVLHTNRSGWPQLGNGMTDNDYANKLDEVDRLLNDPDVLLDAARVWSLLAEVSRHELAADWPDDS